MFYDHFSVRSLLAKLGSRSTGGVGLASLIVQIFDTQKFPREDSKMLHIAVKRTPIKRAAPLIGSKPKFGVVGLESPPPPTMDNFSRQNQVHMTFKRLHLLNFA